MRRRKLAFVLILSRCFTVPLAAGKSLGGRDLVEGAESSLSCAVLLSPQQVKERAI
jgi:hypothetical protein